MSCAPDPFTQLGRCSVIDVLEEFRSKTPAELRALAQDDKLDLPATARETLNNAAAEMEGSEQAYVVLMAQLGELRQKLARTEANLQATLEMVPRQTH
jgi:hypothetical protein